MLESTSGTCAFEVPRTGNRHQPFFGCCPRGVRNWKQACPFFPSCPAWSSAWSSPVPQVRVPGRFAETLDSGPQNNWKNFFTVVGLDNLDIFFAGKNPDLGAGSAGLRCRAGAAGGALGVEPLGEPVLIGRASTHWASHQRGWASQYYWASPYSLGLGEPVLGEPVLIGRARTHWANPYWASHQTRLGRAIKRGWASQYSLGESGHL